MCGLTGCYGGQPAAAAELTATVRAMADAIVHRGPDDSGEWCDADAGYAIGFRRLSIVDLSPAGHQPMPSASGRFVIAFNGEVYNAERIRKRLDTENGSPAYRGHSDTEVMLAAIEHWGLERAVREFIGMFAFALWDRRERVLHLVRDRLGVKPLYYGVANGVLLFGSELKCLRRHPAFDDRIRRGALSSFLRYCYVPAPYSIYERYWKLTPGCILSVRDVRAPLPEPVPYWSAAEVASAGLAQPLTGSEDELSEQLESLLRDSVALRMVADVPVGVFLSGGIDSSLVTALMQAQSTQPVRSFSIGFSDSSYDEAPYAKRVARHLGTAHTELYVSPVQARDVIPKLPFLYDEPFADSSQIPTLLVSQMARQQVTVSLSGDGGDELFAGYNRYTHGPEVWRWLRRVPAPARHALARGFELAPPAMWGALLERAAPLLPKRLRVRQPANKLGKLARLVDADSIDAVYLSLVSGWRTPSAVVIDGDETPAPLGSSHISDSALRMMYLDLVTYLPDDILVKVDRASMGVSLEAREPLLDHRLVEFAWRLPLQMKLRAGVGKWLLRRVLDRYVPSALLDRPKMGFAVPISAWLTGPLREWAESLLAESVLARDGYLRPQPVRALWQSHLLGQRAEDHSELWSVLMFQAWLRANEA